VEFGDPLTTCAELLVPVADRTSLGPFETPVQLAQPKQKLRMLRVDSRDGCSSVVRSGPDGRAAPGISESGLRMRAGVLT
jgi:hypothetical protein